MLEIEKEDRIICGAQVKLQQQILLKKKTKQYRISTVDVNLKQIMEVAWYIIFIGEKAAGTDAENLKWIKQFFIIQVKGRR